jgi:proline iminopeptidase
MDRLADSYRLIYYDQRGRGRSLGEVDLDAIDIGRYVADLAAVQAHFDLPNATLLGHSWGAHVALHYALHHPERVARLVLMNGAPASHADYLRMGAERMQRREGCRAELDAIAEGDAFQRGDPHVVGRYYALAFAAGSPRPERVAALDFAGLSREDVLRGRAIEARLMRGLYWAEGFTLLTALAAIAVPTLVIHGDQDFVPVPCAQAIAAAIPGARLVVVPDCGHFAYCEAPQAVREAIDGAFAASQVAYQER